MSNPETYQSPLTERYASSEMLQLFSPQFRHSTWRKLWVALAQAEHELGLAITQAQLDELRQHVDTIDFAQVAAYEKNLQHDVMAHVHAFGDQCPTAKSIIHLGATSCYVTDNGDTIQIRAACLILIEKLKQVIRQLSTFAEKHADLACLGFTHFQPASLTTVGKRACLWIQDFLMDLQDFTYRANHLRFLGVKGATGTQASFLALFHGDANKVTMLDKRVAELMGFSQLFQISGQTYTRKQDLQLIQTLAGFGASAHKFATDLRLLAHLKEMEEPFGDKQIGSSAMPYKRNPILAERICALSRFLISLSENPAYTHATQWLERSLDDSANRRLVIPEAFLTCDALLELLLKVTSGLIVYPHRIAKHINQELPFMAIENILMACVNKGGDRQLIHEYLRQHSHAAADNVKQAGKENDLLQRILQDCRIGLTQQELNQIMHLPAFTGKAKEQVEEFLKNEVKAKV